MPLDDKKVLACVDQSHFADFVTDAAAWAARRMGAPLELLHILDRQAGRDQRRRPQRRHRLQRPAEPAHRALRRGRGAQQGGARAGPRVPQRPARARRAAASPPDVRQRYGDLEETLVEQAGGVRLFVLGRRGESAETTQRDLGRNVERMVRALSSRSSPSPTSSPSPSA
jgi:hypothetical protein